MRWFPVACGIALLSGCVDEPTGLPESMLESARPSMAIVYGEVVTLSNITELQPLPGEADVRATALNRFGQVVGTSGGRSVIWEQGIPTELPVPGPNSISDDGRVVGGTARTPRRAVLWEEDGTVTEIGPLPGHDESTARINADGVIVGESWSIEEGLAFLWQNEVMTVLPPATGYDRSAASYANATGMVIGTSEDVYTDADPDEFVDFTVWQDGRVVSVVSGRPAPPEEAWAGVSDAGDAYMHNTDMGFMSYRWRAGQVEMFPTPDATPNRHVFAVSADGYVLLGFGGVNGIWKDDVFRPLDEGIVSSCSAIAVDGWLVCKGPGRQYQFLAQLELDTPASPWVSDLAVANVDGPAVTLSWTQVDDGTGSPASYRLKYAAPPIAWRTATIGCTRTMQGTAIGAPMSCTVGGLQGTTAYEFQLMSFGVEDDVWVDAVYSNRAATTTGVVPVQSVLDLAIESATRRTMTVRWTQVDDGTGNPASYRVKYAEPPIAWNTATRSRQAPFARDSHECASEILGTQIGEEMSCLLELPATATTYEVQVMSFRAENGVWVSAAKSNIAVGTTLRADAPGAVDDLEIIAITHDPTQSSLTLRWSEVDDGAGQPAWYRVKYGTPLLDWKIATVGCARTIVGVQVGAEMTCVISGVPWGMVYEVQLMSYRMVDGVWMDALYSNLAWAPVGAVSGSG